MAVSIRMKQFGRHGRHFYRIVAIDKRRARDGDVLEILGTYDPSVKIKESRVILKATRIKYWLSVGAQPSDHVAIFLEKYMEKFEKAEAAASSGIKTVIIPRANLQDVLLDDKYQDMVKVVAVDSLDEVMQHALIKHEHKESLVERLSSVIDVLTPEVSKKSSSA